MRTTLKINLVAPPSRGKTSISYKIAAELKLEHQADVEVVNEYSKELAFMGVDLTQRTIKEDTETLQEQIRRENIFKDKVDILITSSPILIQTSYFKNQDLEKIALTESKKWNEVYFYLEKDPSFKFQSNRESWNSNSVAQFEEDLKQFCQRLDIKLIKLRGTPEHRVQAIINYIDEQSIQLKTA
jgi:hypothetical protein